MANITTRIRGFVRRLAKGEDVVQVTQSKEGWERQFAKGSWSFLADNHPNTNVIAGVITRAVSKSSAPLRVLDVGCGNGALSSLLRPLLPHISYVGIDISETAVEQARLLFPEGTFYAVPAEHPPKDLGTFDIVVFNEVFFYVNPEIVLPQYKNLLSREGVAIVSIIKSWRSRFVWQRVNRHMAISERVIVRDMTRDHVFTIVSGTITSSHES